jgi:hypothetical protein
VVYRNIVHQTVYLLLSICSTGPISFFGDISDTALLDWFSLPQRARCKLSAMVINSTIFLIQRSISASRAYRQEPLEQWRYGLLLMAKGFDLDPGRVAHAVTGFKNPECLT